MATIKITDSNSGEVVRLWQSQEDAEETSSDPRIDSIPGRDTDATFITTLNQQVLYTYSGIVTGRRLSQVSSPNTYSSDPNTALAEWVARFESFVNGGQAAGGSGYELDDGDRGDVVNGAIKSAEWKFRRGEKFQVEWDLEFQVGEPAMFTNTQTIDSVSPSTSATIDSVDLHEVGVIRTQLEQKFDGTPIPFKSASETILVPDSGGVKRVTILGRVDGNNSTRNTFDSNMESKVGGGIEVTYNSAFPGRSETFAVESFEGTRKAGLTRLGEYALVLIEGEVVT